MNARFPRRTLVGAVALIAVVAVPPAAHGRWNVGAATLQGGISDAAPTTECPTRRVLTATATGVVANTVLTGDIGEITLAGTFCGNGPEVTMHAHAVGPTGSTLHCDELVGSFPYDGATGTLAVSGPCIVNNFDTGTMTYVGRVVAVATGGFAGSIAVEFDASR